MTSAFPVLIPLVYLAGVLGFGLACRGRVRDELDYFLARRSGGVLLVGGSLVATMFGAFGVLGLSGEAVRLGLPAVWYLWGGALGLFLLAGWAVPRLPVSDVYTLPEMLGRAYGQPVRALSAALIALAWISLIAAQMIAAGKVAVFALDTVGWGNVGDEGRVLPAAIAVMAVVMVAYTWLGGQYSVLRTDLLQAALIVVALAVLLVATGGRLPEGWAAAEAGRLRFPFNDRLPPGPGLALIVTFGAPFLVGPDIYSRLFSGRDVATVRRAVLLGAAIMIPLAFMVALAGVMAPAALGGEIADRDTAILALARARLSPLWIGLLAAALLSAVMSSADTCLLTVSTLVTRDLARSRRAESQVTGPDALPRARAVVLVAGALSLMAALWFQEIVAALWNCYRVYSPAILVPFLAMALFPGRRFGRLTGAAAMLTGAGAAVASLELKSPGLLWVAYALPAAPLAIDLLARPAGKES